MKIKEKEKPCRDFSPQGFLKDTFQEMKCTTSL